MVDAVKAVAIVSPAGSKNALASIVTNYAYPICNDPESTKVADTISASAEKTGKISGMVGKGKVV